jgi:uncharacterized protein (DUF952 family)
MVLHILKRDEWDAAKRGGIYAPPTLATEGFIHCSTIAQVVETANLFFRGQADLVILSIDESRLKEPLKHEAPAMAGHERTDALFPHLYGPLNLDAVIGVHNFPCDGDGRFTLPAELRS